MGENYLNFGILNPSFYKVSNTIRFWQHQPASSCARSCSLDLGHVLTDLLIRFTWQHCHLIINLLKRGNSQLNHLFLKLCDSDVLNEALQMVSVQYCHVLPIYAFQNLGALSQVWHLSLTIIRSKNPSVFTSCHTI